MVDDETPAPSTSDADPLVVAVREALKVEGLPPMSVKASLRLANAVLLAARRGGPSKGKLPA